ncbi:MAG: ABC transporter permease, partial [Leptospiraceae bacterium]|nr:ABC transporter permease [Leptospiraceae bacterium]
MVFLAFKQLFSRPQQTVLTFLAILLGTTGYIMFSGMMLGFQEIIIDQLINNNGQVIISARDDLIRPQDFKNIFFENRIVKWIKPPSGRHDSEKLTNAIGWMKKLENDERIIAWAPQLKRQVVLAHGKAQEIVTLSGIQASRHRRTTNLENYIVHGSLTDLEKSDSSIILGSGLMTSLGARQGDTVKATYGSRNPVMLKVVGMVDTGSRMLDNSSAYASVRSVQNISASGGEISSLIVKLHDVEAATGIANEWKQFSHDKVESWDQANEGIMSVFKTQDIVRNTITGVIALIIAFGIYNILNMVVNHKKRDIA